MAIIAEMPPEGKFWAAHKALAERAALLQTRLASRVDLGSRSEIQDLNNFKILDRSEIQDSSGTKMHKSAQSASQEDRADKNTENHLPERIVQFDDLHKSTQSSQGVTSCHSEPIKVHVDRIVQFDDLKSKDPDGFNDRIIGKYAATLKHDPAFLQARGWGSHPAYLTLAIQKYGLEKVKQEIGFVAGNPKILKPAGYLKKLLPV